MPTAAHPEPHPPRRLHCPVVDMPFSATSVGTVRGRPTFPEFLPRECECRWAVYFRCIPLLLACCMSLPFRTASPCCLTFQLALPINPARFQCPVELLRRHLSERGPGELASPRHSFAFRSSRKRAGRRSRLLSGS